MNELGFFMKNTLNKSERLCSKKIFDKIFAQGKTVKNDFLKIIWVFSENENNSPAKVAFAISKRNIRKATSRNFIRRRIREAYRVRKKILYTYLQNNNLQISFVILYRASEMKNFNQIEDALNALLLKFVEKIELDTKQ